MGLLWGYLYLVQHYEDLFPALEVRWALGSCLKRKLLKPADYGPVPLTIPRCRLWN